MKKIYFVPAVQEIEIKTTGILCGSLGMLNDPVSEPLAPELPGMGGIPDLPPLVNLPGFTE